MISFSRPRSAVGILALGLAASVLTGCGLGGGNTKTTVAPTTTAKSKVTVPASTGSTNFATIPVPVTVAAPTTLAPGQTGGVTTGAQGGQTPQPGDKYIVKSGDIPSLIAQAMGVSVSALLDANGLTQKAIIKPGDLLVVPTGGIMPAGGTDPKAGPAGNTAQPQATGIPTTTIAGVSLVGSSKYTVLAGDSWYGIARKFGVNPDTLLAINKATTATVIHAGQVIVIPAKASTPATTVKK